MDWIDELFSEGTLDQNADYVQLDMIEGLLKTSTISAEENEAISKSLNSLSYKEAYDLIIYLSNKQVCRITAGLNYNATYLNKFLKSTI